MMNKPEESPFQLALRPESELIRAESPAVGRLRKALRIEFKRNADVISILRSTQPQEEKANAVAEKIAENFELVTHDEVRRESLALIQEFEYLEDKGIQEIITDSQGRGVVPVTKDTVYYPTRIDPNGNESLGLPILHPAISSGIMMREVESNEISRLERLSPVYAFNVQIERTTEPLETRIREDLERRGWTLRANEGELYTEVVGKELKITLVGKERNPAFSRVPIWSHVFIASIPGTPRDIELIAIDRCEDDMHRWYEITYRAAPQNQE